MELPELTVLSRQMKKELVGKEISRVKVANSKCLNMPYTHFKEALVGEKIKFVESRGKWIFIHLNSHILLFNPGMGSDVIYFESEAKIPARHHILFKFEDGTGFTIRVWWFCYLHLIHEKKVSEHRFVGKLGVPPLSHSFTINHFQQLLSNKRGRIKNFLLNQRNIAGIGNVYVQDILFNANVHPDRKIQTLNERDIENLFNSIQTVLAESIELGGLAYEKNFYGGNGGYGAQQFKIAYKPGAPCPTCGTTIQKIKTGSTSSFVCTKCQSLENPLA